MVHLKYETLEEMLKAEGTLSVANGGRVFVEGTEEYKVWMRSPTMERALAIMSGEASNAAFDQLRNWYQANA